MRRFTLNRFLYAGTFIAILLCLHPPPPARGESPPRPPEAYLAEVEAIGEPDFDPARKREPGYLELYKAEQHALYREKAAVLLELCRAHPNDPRMPEWMSRRWVLLGWNQTPEAVADEVLADIDAILRSEPVAPSVQQDAAYWQAFYRAHKLTEDADAMYQAVAPFLRAYPADDRGAALLELCAAAGSADRKLKRRVYRRLAADYPQTHAGQYAPGMLRRLDAIGQPFELEFDDELTGRSVSLRALRGKIVVIDFWATTCPPCVAKAPELLELYERYAPRGVEFIGVSLDESEERGGRRALRTFLEKRSIPWPQYYQGNGYDSDFSKSWGVGSAPTLFVVDRKGLLRTTDAQDDLEGWLKRLLDE